MRYVLMLVILAFCLVAPGTLFFYVSWGGIKPDLVMLWVIYLALNSSPRSALLLSLATGLLTDFYYNSSLGLYTLTLTLVAFLSAWLQQRWYRDNLILVALLVFSVTLCGQLIVALLAALAGFGWTLGEAVRVALGMSAYNALLVPLIHPFLHRSFTRGWLRKRTKYDY